MNLPLIHPNNALRLACALLLLASASAAQAQLLLTINVTDPDAVTFTATNGAAGSSVTLPVQDGIDLIGFLQNTPSGYSNLPNDSVTTSNLTAYSDNSGNYYNQYSNDNQAGTTNPFGAFTDLGLFTAGNTNDLTFTQGSTALTGALTINFSLENLTAYLPSAGTSGEIITGYNGSGNGTNELIGTYQVITAPEPSSSAMIGVSLVLLALLRPLLARLKRHSSAVSDRI